MDRAVKLHRSSRSSEIDRGADAVWAVVAGAGPGPHWYVDAAPFVLRGAIDRGLGGEGRRWPVPDRPLLETGDEAGFWRVTAARPRTLRLEAQVRAPGGVTLEIQVEQGAGSGCTVRQSITFEPDGLVGQLYMLADLPAREAVAELSHRALLSEIERSSR